MEPKPIVDVTEPDRGAIPRDQVWIRERVERFGLLREEWSEWRRVVARLARALEAGFLTRSELDVFLESLGEPYLRGSLQGRIFSRSRGYMGDFEVLDHLYDQVVSSDRRFAGWDEWIHQQPASRALRNRPDHLVRTVLGRRRATNGLRILSLGSGACRDLERLLSVCPDLSAEFVCVDQDEGAHESARDRCAEHLDRIEFVCENVLHYRARPDCFDVIWSAGLTDYLDDRLCVRLLRRALRMCRVGGEVVFGNFSVGNPTRDHMETIGHWYLIHRSPQDLIEIAKAAGAAEGQAHVQAEPEGINLFLHVRKGHPV